MGIFQNLFGKSKTTDTAPTNLPPCKSKQELLERYGCIALEKQIDFGDMIGGNRWNIDMNTETLSFSPDLVFPIQALGTIAHEAQTWLWAWGNAQSNLSESVIRQSLQLKKYGEENGIPFLSDRTFAFTKDELHVVGAIASGMFGSSGYYICDYGKGAMVVTVKSDKIDKARKGDHFRVMTVIPQFISEFEVNAKNAVTNYLMLKGYAPQANGHTVSGTKNGQTVTAEFDDLGRLTAIRG